MLLKNEMWLKDLDLVLGQSEDFKKLEGKSVLITGATGLICSAVVDLFIRYNETRIKPVSPDNGSDSGDDRYIKILAACRNEEKARNRFGEYFDREYFKFVHYDATAEKLGFDFESDYVIHGASNAFPSKIVGEPVETMLSNFSGLYKLLEYARSVDAKRVLYISSSEIYGNRTSADEEEQKKPFTENEYGFIDLLSPRSCYPISKRAAETLCVCYQAEYNVSTVIVRPGHIYGPTASLADNRISSDFARMAASGEKLVMRSPGSQMRSYMHCLDTASAMIKVLLEGEGGKAYNVSNPDSIISIRQLAEYLAKAGNVELEFDIPNADDAIKFSVMTNASLNSESLEKLDWKGCFDAEKGLDHTVQVLKLEMQNA